MVYELPEAVWIKEMVPTAGQKAELVPAYKQKGDPL